MVWAFVIAKHDRDGKQVYEMEAAGWEPEVVEAMVGEIGDKRRPQGSFLHDGLMYTFRPVMVQL